MDSKGTNTFQLINGLKANGVVHKDVELRDITAGDILEANEKSREVFFTPQGAVLMSPTDKVMMYLMCRIIVKLGDLQMPLSDVEFKKLTATDYDLLTEKYLEIREKANIAALGRDNQPLSDNT